LNINKSWQLGSPDSWLYRVFDTLRESLNHRLVQWLAQSLAGRANCVLEAGSGTASATSLFARQPNVHFSLAADLDMEALLLARRRKPELPLVAADLHALPFKPGSFDLVWNSSTLEHLPKMRPALEEMRRCVAADGMVFVGVPYLFGPLGFQRIMTQTDIGRWIGTVFSRAELVREIHASNLQPQKHFLYFFHFFIGILAKKLPTKEAV